MSAAWLFGAGPLQAAPSVEFTPSFEAVSVGQVFELVLMGHSFDLTASGDTIINLTGGQGLQFSFSPTVIEVLSLSIDPRWNFAPGNRPGTIDPVAGTVTGMSFGAFPAVTDDDFTIARFSVKALAAGDATLVPTVGSFIGRVGTVSGQSIAATFAAAAVSVVPEPQAWMLMLMGGAGLALWSIRPARGGGDATGRR